ncbi:unnamed protein product [Arabis nemorensis]|uniref:Uncharacterized protein n=1 Tax=Arabis nemorensis TaxID=586526 RepID=A0A565BRK8_9BRAS|nr:unnamed protein product [Arabis nemorensis]
MAVSAIGFEGFEKRLEVSFFEPNVFLDPEGKGLRALTKSQLDEILTPAACTIPLCLSLQDHNQNMRDYKAALYDPTYP